MKPEKNSIDHILVLAGMLIIIAAGLSVFTAALLITIAWGIG